MIAALSIILVNYNERDHVRRVVTALHNEFPPDTTEILVVDNDSTDNSAAMVRSEFPFVILLEPHANLFYGKGNNVGLARATGDWVMILNPDVEWQPGALRKVVDWARTKPGVDLAAPRLIYRDGRTQTSAHRRFPSLWTVFVDYCLPLQQLFMRGGRHPYQLSTEEHATSRTIAHATGACLLVRRDVVRDIGEFDPQFSMYLEETDWQARMAAAGYQRWLCAETSITHFGSAQKSFAQASPHYLWGLRHYASKHWSLNQQAWLPSVVMAATVISTVFLLAALFPSYFLKKSGQRLRHYLGVYLQVMTRILHWPRYAPDRS